MIAIIAVLARVLLPLAQRFEASFLAITSTNHAEMLHIYPSLQSAEPARRK